MNELEMSTKLGLLLEPVENKVKMDLMVREELIYLQYVLDAAKCQKKMIGAANPDLWCELVPWHSLN